MIRFLALLLALLCCTACTNITHLPALPDYDFYIDPNCSPQTRAAIDEGVKQWTEFTDVHITTKDGFGVCFEGCFLIKEVPQSELAEPGHNYVGLTVWGAIAVAGGMDWDETSQTVTHEMGHALGLSHHDLPAIAVMNPVYQHAAKHVACDDVEQYYSVRGESAPGAGIVPCTDVAGELDSPPVE